MYRHQAVILAGRVSPYTRPSIPLLETQAGETADYSSDWITSCLPANRPQPRISLRASGLRPARPFVWPRDLSRVRIAGTRAGGVSRGRSWGATVAGNDLPLSIRAVPCVHNNGIQIERTSVVNAGPSANQCHN